MGFMCANCPQKLLISMAEKMGITVENLNCPWWWKITVTDETSKQNKDIDICGVEALPRFLHDFGACNIQVAGAIESMRNEQSEGLAGLINVAKQRMAVDALVVKQLIDNHIIAPVKEIGPIQDIKDVIG